mmetsp:Transcript_1606/g.5305  ORF Transcript_1606/g.5305 Transcript_1606/m.5305 type:complete len:212 (+) Transcript_1606:585-1220(+)
MPGTATGDARLRFEFCECLGRWYPSCPRWTRLPPTPPYPSSVTSSVCWSYGTRITCVPPIVVSPSAPARYSCALYNTMLPCGSRHIKSPTTCRPSLQRTEILRVSSSLTSSTCALRPSPAPVGASRVVSRVVSSLLSRVDVPHAIGRFRRRVLPRRPGPAPPSNLKSQISNLKYRTVNREPPTSNLEPWASIRRRPHGRLMFQKLTRPGRL